MSTFQVPFSSSPVPPSTPDASSKRNRFSARNSSDAAPHPSTTPLGPPPSSVGSFTPAGPPPSSFLGSSQIEDGNLSSQPRRDTQHLQQSFKSKRYSNGTGSLFSQAWDQGSNGASPRGSPLDQGLSQWNGKQSYASSRPGTEANFDTGGGIDNQGLSFPSLYGSSPAGHATTTHGQTFPAQSPLRLPTSKTFAPSSSALSFSSPRGAKRSRAGDVFARPAQSSLKTWPKSQDTIISVVAQDVVKRMPLADLTEPLEFIVELERCMQSHGSAPDAQAADQRMPQIQVYETSQSVSTLLEEMIPNVAESQQTVQSLQIGPDEDAPPLEKAAWLGYLLLRLHNPSLEDLGRLRNKIARDATQDVILSKPLPISRTLLAWLNRCHNPWISVVSEVSVHKPAPSAHRNFWDAVLLLVLRGKLDSACLLLQNAGFERIGGAANELGYGAYTRSQAENTERALFRASEVLQQCPGNRSDWDVDGNTWTFFRRAARDALKELELVPDSDQNRSQDFGRSSAAIPSKALQSLKMFYGVLLGGESEILASAQDWVEATVALTVWGTPDDTTKMIASTLSGSMHTHLPSMPSAFGDSRSPIERLSTSFRRVTDDSRGDSFQVNTHRPAELGLACFFDGDYDNAFEFLRRWSLPVIDSVVELATAGGWYIPSPVASDAVMRNFDEEDLMVLSSYGEPNGSPLEQDQIKIEYATAVFKRGQQQPNSNESRTAFELALSILSRLNNRAIYSKQIEDMLTEITVETEATMDAILDVCQRCDMEMSGYKIAEKYADRLMDDTDDYGKALKYYARSNAINKIRNVLDLLISMSLIRSDAFPAQESLDEDLKAFLENSDVVFEEQFKADEKGATLLREYMSGYGTVRSFYDLRKRSTHGQLRDDRSRRALFAAIASASDNIDGGILDNQRTALIRYEALLVLLGEALGSMKDEDSTDRFEVWQCVAIIRAMENLQTLPEEHYQRAEEFLHSALAYHHGRTRTLSPSKLIQTMSSMTSGSSFSLVSSSLLESMAGDSFDHDSGKEESPQGSSQGRGDWRAGMRKDAAGSDVMRLLRLKLAQRLAGSWMESK